MKQYQIVYVRSERTNGAETQKDRPWVIVSPSKMNKHLKTVVACPLTRTAKDNYPTRISFESKRGTSYIAADQIQTIDKTRIDRPIGHLPSDTIKDLKRVIKEMFVD